MSVSRKPSLDPLFRPFEAVSTASDNFFFLDYSLPRFWLRRIFFALLFIGALGYELRTSTLEAWVLSHYAARLSYEVLPGPSQALYFPTAALPTSDAVIPGFLFSSLAWRLRDTTWRNRPGSRRNWLNS